MGICACQLNSRIVTGKITNYSIIRVNEFIVSTLGNKKIIVVLNIDDTGEQNPGSRIGAPTDIAKVRGQESHQSPRSYGNSPEKSTTGKGENNVHDPTTGKQLIPIAGLTIYSSRWMIRAKVMAKYPIKTWSNARGSGKLFSVILLDSSKVDVRCTFFKEAVDKFYYYLEEGRVYTFSGGRTKVADMNYNKCKSHFEITFDQYCEIHLQENDPGNDIREEYNFVKIAHLETKEPKDRVDIVAVVKGVGEPTTVVSKTSNKELTKCDLTLQDDSGAEVQCTVWGETATASPRRFASCPVVAFKRARVVDYQGERTLSANSYTVQPDIGQVAHLEKWWSELGDDKQVRGLTIKPNTPCEARKNLSSIKSEQLGCNKEDWITFKATILLLKKEKQNGDPAWYTACANSAEPCRNLYKVEETSLGKWRCNKCNETRDDCVRRFVLYGTMADDTCTSWVTVFNKEVELLLEGKTADELFEKMCNESSGVDEYNSMFAKCQYTDWIVKCKVKEEVHNDEKRTKTTVSSLSAVDYVVESRNLLKELCE